MAAKTAHADIIVTINMELSLSSAVTGRVRTDLLPEIVPVSYTDDAAGEAFEAAEFPAVFDAGGSDDAGFAEDGMLLPASYRTGSLETSLFL